MEIEDGLMEIKDEILNINELCRLCLKIRTNMRCIFGGGNDIKVDDIKEKILYFAMIEIIPNDGLPSLICLECVENTTRSYEFKTQCEYSDYKLRSYVKNVTNRQNTETDLEIESETPTECKAVKKEIEITEKNNLQLKNTENESIISSSDFHISCEKCTFSFKTEKELKKHKRVEHNDCSKLTCDICKQTFAHSQTLSRHKKLHRENKKNNLCTICGKSFHRTDDMKRHMRTHTNERPYACTLCPKSYKQSSELTDHLNSHSNNKNFICTECGKSLATRNGLYVHMKVHRGEKNHMCKVCGNKYVTTGELTSHMNHIHSRAKPFVCSYEGCSRAFVTKLSLATHTRSHTGERPFQCLVCNKYLSTASSLQDHKRTHTGEKLKTCDNCGQKLGNAQALKKHLRIHSGERPYRCQFCFESFICSSSLSSHVKIKHMDKEHQCATCKKMFALPSKLRQHMKIHNKDNQDLNKSKQQVDNLNVNIYENKDNTFDQTQEIIRSFNHNNELYKSTNQVAQKLTFDIKDCSDSGKILPQFVPINQVTISQMIIPQYL